MAGIEEASAVILRVPVRQEVDPKQSKMVLLVFDCYGRNSGH